MNEKIPMKLNNTQRAILLATSATAFVHLILLNIHMGGIDPGFTLNGLGYLSLLAAYLFIPQLKARHSLVRLALMAFAALTIIAWLVLGDKGINPIGILGYLTKLDELVLIYLLWKDK